jgi:hypothetical protein
MEPAGFSRDAACAIVGIPISTLTEWEQKAGRGGGDSGARPFALSDLLVLAVMREMARRIDSRIDAFACGLRQLSQELAAVTDVERADHLCAVIGPRFGVLRQASDEDSRLRERDTVVVPLRPLLSELRDLVFP